MIQLEKNKVLIKDDTCIQALRHTFETKHCFTLDELISPKLKAFIISHLEKADYQKKIHSVKNSTYIIGEEFMIEQNSFLSLFFSILFNTNEFIDVMKKITGLALIQSCHGRIYKLDSSDDCFDNWHDDIKPDEGRLIGFSINLSTEIYNGGTFIIRHKATKEIYDSVKHDTWGSGHFFRIDKSLHHKVEKVKGKTPRIAYAGWFVSEIDTKKNFVIKE